MLQVDSETTNSPEEKIEKGNRQEMLIGIFAVLTLISVILIMTNLTAEKAYSRCKDNVKRIGIALEMYSTDHAGHYPQELKQLTPYYISTLPTCPRTGSSKGYEESYRTACSPDNYTFYCKGNHHREVGILPDHPKYNGCYGIEDGAIPGSKRNILRKYLKFK